ncbi:hypothetical protein [Gordonia sp. N1V]|uniref:hypothetical protein n=1 Tax=Gordonia sp. N1V TaxID=3034163 RepID=UPI0023E0AC64|nr:hypothetical protein [Gordonia sp. N1V]MDF3280867.1 hypothetical protein [Gordonia sp. N1V]
MAAMGGFPGSAYAKHEAAVYLNPKGATMPDTDRQALQNWFDVFKGCGVVTGRVEDIRFGIDGRLVIEGQIYAGDVNGQLRVGDTVHVITDSEDTLLADELDGRDKLAEDLFYDQGREDVETTWRKRLNKARGLADALQTKAENACSEFVAEIDELVNLLKGTDEK